MPPRIPSRLEYIVSNGIMTINASTRGMYEKIDRVKPQRRQCVDLFVDFHRADLSRIGRPGAPGHDNGGHERRHFAHHGQRDEIRRIDTGPECLELHDTDKSEDHAEQKADQAHDGQGLGTGLLDVLRQIGF